MRFSVVTVLALIGFGLNTFAADSKKIEVNPTVIISATQSPKAKSPEIRYGFFDSSFDYSDRNGLTPANKSMCYVGKADDVCGIIRNVEKQILQVYGDGAHDYIEVSNCQIENGTNVEVKYRLVDDYGGNLNVKRTISECLR